jgi:hypothetical protein
MQDSKILFINARLFLRWFKESNAILDPAGKWGIFGVVTQIVSGISDWMLSSLSKSLGFIGNRSVAFGV